MKEVDLQTAHDDPNGYHYACYDCALVGPENGTYGSGSLYLNDEMEVMSHLKAHVRNGDHVRNEMIDYFVKFFRRDTHVHQSLMDPHRRSQNKREMAFFEEWLHQQDSDQLAIKLLASWGIQHETTREVRIMASLIQWLGTNIGFCFLEMALRRCGYKIVPFKGADQS